MAQRKWALMPLKWSIREWFCAPHGGRFVRESAREMGLIRAASSAGEEVRSLAGGAGSPGRTILRAKFPANRENNRNLGAVDDKRSVRSPGLAGESRFPGWFYPLSEQGIFLEKQGN
jgi:hypothetical protein